MFSSRTLDRVVLATSAAAIVAGLALIVWHPIIVGAVEIAATIAMLIWRKRGMGEFRHAVPPGSGGHAVSLTSPSTRQFQVFEDSARPRLRRFPRKPGSPPPDGQPPATGDRPSKSF